MKPNQYRTPTGCRQQPPSAIKLSTNQAVCSGITAPCCLSCKPRGQFDLSQSEMNFGKTAKASKCKLKRPF